MCLSDGEVVRRTESEPGHRLADRRRVRRGEYLASATVGKVDGTDLSGVRLCPVQIVQLCLRRRRQLVTVSNTDRLVGESHGRFLHSEQDRLDRVVDCVRLVRDRLRPLLPDDVVQLHDGVRSERRNDEDHDREPVQHLRRVALSWIEVHAAPPAVSDRLYVHCCFARRRSATPVTPRPLRLRSTSNILPV